MWTPRDWERSGRSESDEIGEIRAGKAVGELLGHYFNAAGQPVAEAVSARALSPTLDHLRASRVVALAGGKLEFRLTGDAPLVSAAAVNDGAWHHVVTSVGPAGQQVFLDGTLIGTGSWDKTVKLIGVFGTYDGDGTYHKNVAYGAGTYSEDGLLLAHPTFDLWSYGVVLYYAIAHKPLLETTGADQLRGKAERIKLARWSTADLTYAINDLDHGGFSRAQMCVF